MATYDFKPSVYEANGNGSFIYRWDIKEVQGPVSFESSGGVEVVAETETITQWECQEVIVWATVTQDKITESVVNKLWSQNYEAKLVNDYNAAKEGVFGDPTNEKAQFHIIAYMNFLTERKLIKEQIKSDCESLKIK